MNFQRYLSAKRTVDDRALNRRVEEALAAEVEDRDHLRVLEVGAGTGATAERLLARPWLPDRTTYTGLDLRPDNVATVRKRLPERAMAMGYAVRADGNRFVASRRKRRVEIDFVVADAFEYLPAAAERWDLLVAHAFVDLVDPTDALATFRDALASDGIAYCPITFDGGTFFEPVADRAFEAHLVERFHRHIDESGDSKAGRRLLSAASRNKERGGNDNVLAAGGSDWLVRPRDGNYSADEAYFLHCIVDMVAGAVHDDPEVADDRLSGWVSQRRDQIDDATLVYCAHHLDLLFK